MMTNTDLNAFWRPPAAATLLAAAFLVAFIPFRRLAKGTSKLKPLRQVILSPRDTLISSISSKQALTLAYPPSLLPGARDVDTQYGTMRVYEWGPLDGLKVLLVHGDSTPAPILGPIGHALVARGCRVMMFGMPSWLVLYTRAHRFALLR